MVCIKVLIIVIYVLIRFAALLLAILKLYLEALLQILDLLLTSQKDQDTTSRQILMNLDHLLESLLNIVFLGGLVIMNSDFELSCLYVDHTRYRLIQI
jgi:hypothetical protein